MELKITNNEEPVKPGPKKKKKLTVAQKSYNLKEQLIDATKSKDLLEIWEKVIEGAKSGNKENQKLFFEYAIGKPDQVIHEKVEQLTGKEILSKVDEVFGIKGIAQEIESETSNEQED